VAYEYTFAPQAPIGVDRSYQGRRNNFIEYAQYSDSTCQTKTESFAYLVNYVNLKDDTLVELEYDKSGCGGVPIR
ncbi:unnamed protein product, partial [Symbiodinium microadriaticum]